ncbi:MAG: hypothetical protein O6952_00240 [Planctomycetota bacterium]|nr:hypothetical protein [Planctomycetota bacterium]
MSNRFVVFLPPDVGGLGGGGTIQLDLSDLIRFAARTDSLPGAYRHEFGHNLGFGHDPYMFMAPCGIDDELFGETGYRMVNGRTMRRVFDYLNRPLPDPADPWKPSRNVFAAIGLLYGPDVHKKMFEVRVGAEPVLKQAGLSVIERIAAQYSFAAGDFQNMAWIFRAFGWPVLDERIWRAWFTVKQQEFRKKGAIPKYIAGFQMRQWWIQGPLPLLQDRDPEEAPEPPPWRYLKWREDFVNLPAGPPERKSVGYRLFHRIESARRMDALLVCGSDVQLDLLLNGQALSRIRASPQMSQPRHDDYRLESWAQSVIPVTFQKGENLLEAVAVQPRGSKGFFLAIANYDGKTPGGLRLRTAGPEDPEGTKIKAEALDRRPPVHNPSFEDGGSRPGPWIVGPVEPRGSMKWTWDTESALKGTRCLELTANGSTRGALIQRIILEPGAEYVLSGAMKSKDLSGKDCEAYICLFLQDPYSGHLARTEPMKAGTTRWLAFKTKFYPRKRRVAYIGCVLVGSGGTVWFDEVRLTRK